MYPCARPDTLLVGLDGASIVTIGLGGSVGEDETIVQVPVPLSGLLPFRLAVVTLQRVCAAPASAVVAAFDTLTVGWPCRMTDVQVVLVLVLLTTTR